MTCDKFVVDEDGDPFWLMDVDVLECLTVFGASTEAMLAAKCEELAKITATIAEMEAKLVDEKTLKVGDYVRQTSTTRLVRIVEDDRSILPHKMVPR
ncbi:hypothetical protein [Paenibacillus sp. Aloe-11]|uniref:hypothetical protein n=1 Tax=Paenibacillus sp. Aloe-11 TaxID=1050222 RepID=UPI00024EF8F5|nr:hypothetical protein [Paenibacillus sp. Aloe-11]EHS55989.1 hypothetical protein WG8_3966 [Paenibacillus sp. Aloe-11]